MIRRRLALAAGSLGLVAAGGAGAQPVQSLYIGAGTFWNAKQIEPIGPVPSFGIGTSERLRPDSGGIGVVGSVGYGLGAGFRVELEASYRQEGIRMFATTVPGTGSGSQQEYGAMVNALYDLDLRPLGVSFVTPYVGVGLGYQWSHLNGLVTVRDNGIVSHLGGTDGDFAYQAIVGAAFPISAVPGLSLTAEYRFLSIPGGTTVHGEAYAAPRIRLTSQIQLTQNLNHSVVIGLRYAFNTPAPADATVVAEPPRPREARSFQVTFPTDQAELSAAAMQTLARAAQEGSAVATTKILVNAPTRAAGELPTRRVQAVVNALMRFGIPPAAVQVAGYGNPRPIAQPSSGGRPLHEFLIILG